MTEGSEEAEAKAQPETQRPERSEGTLQKKIKKEGETLWKLWKLKD